MRRRGYNPYEQQRKQAKRMRKLEEENRRFRSGKREEPTGFSEVFFSLVIFLIIIGVIGFAIVATH